MREDTERARRRLRIVQGIINRLRHPPVEESTYLADREGMKQR